MNFGKIHRLFLIILAVACSSLPTHGPGNIENKPSVKEEVETKIILNDLEIAFQLYEEHLWAEALNYFQECLDSGELSTQGKSIVYWTMANCHIELKNADYAAEYFFFFILSVEQMIENSEDSYLELFEMNKQFMKDYEIRSKVDLANNFILTLWKLKNKR